MVPSHVPPVGAPPQGWRALRPFCSSAWSLGALGPADVAPDPRTRTPPLSTIAPTQLWTAALGRLQVEVPRPNFDTWLKGTQALGYDDGCLVIGTPNAFAATMLEKRLSSTIVRSLEHVAGQPVSVRFEVIADPSAAPDSADADSSRQAAPKPATAVKDGRSSSVRLDPRFTFDQFVVGPSNELANAAATRVALEPGRVYNPLYIYAQVGLGKTHLLQGIAHELIQRGLQVIYVSSERFTNDYIRAIQAGTTESFREQYRSVDALLIDDIQFIAGKAQTQEGFFHTFNELHMAGRQVVVTGDEPARRSLLEQRIQSRLEGGLVVDIQPPDYETRMAILREKSKSLHIRMPETVLTLIASRPLSNVRELEGALNRIVAQAQMANASVTLELARQSLGDLLTAPPDDPITPAAILRAVADHFATDIETLKGPRRSKEIAFARHVAMYLLRETSSLSSPQVGLALGGKDHSTVLYAQRKIETQLERDPALRHTLATIQQSIAKSRRPR